jgi:hypothetical protein
MTKSAFTAGLHFNADSSRHDGFESAAHGIRHDNQWQELDKRHLPRSFLCDNKNSSGWGWGNLLNQVCPDSMICGHG